jgi:hypothetical protein
MPIVIDRKTGATTASPKMSSQQNQKAWEQILRTYVNNHPEVLSDEKIKGEAS